MAHLSRQMPRHQFDPGCSQAFADVYEGLETATPVTQIDPDMGAESSTPVTPDAAAPQVTRDVAKLELSSMKVSKVPHLSRKSSLRYRECHACHANAAAPQVSRDVAKLPLTSMKVESATPVTQIEPEVPKVPRLSRKRRGATATRDAAKGALTSMKVLKVPHLSRKSSLRY